MNPRVTERADSNGAIQVNVVSNRIPLSGNFNVIGRAAIVHGKEAPATESRMLAATVHLLLTAYVQV